jgi:hypothetical protein
VDAKNAPTGPWITADGYPQAPTASIRYLKTSGTHIRQPQGGPDFGITGGPGFVDKSTGRSRALRSIATLGSKHGQSSLGAEPSGSTQMVGSMSRKSVSTVSTGIDTDRHWPIPVFRYSPLVGIPIPMADTGSDTARLQAATGCNPDDDDVTEASLVELELLFNADIPGDADR